MNINNEYKLMDKIGKHICKNHSVCGVVDYKGVTYRYMVTYKDLETI